MRRGFKYDTARDLLRFDKFRLPVFAAVFAVLVQERPFVMKLYIVMEGDGIACPQDLAELFYGVFSSREAATKCMERHCRYMSSFGWSACIGKDGKATDKNGNVYFQVVEWELDSCRAETWI